MKNLIYLILIGSLIANSLVFIEEDNSKTITDITFSKSGDGKFYFFQKDVNDEFVIYCNNIIKFVDINNNPIAYDCDAELPQKNNERTKLFELIKKGVKAGTIFSVIFMIIGVLTFEMGSVPIGGV